MPDRWRWQTWGETLRDLRERRDRLERVLRWTFVVVALAGAALTLLGRDLRYAVVVAVAAWAVLVAWFAARGVASLVTSAARRSVLRDARAAIDPPVDGLAAEELERLVTVGRTESRGRLVEATVDGDQVVVTQRGVPGEWLAGGPVDPGVPFGFGP